MPAISIIIPVYKVEKYLRRCLDSVLNQTFTDWTAICVNDGSPDNSGEILAEYAERDKRIRVVNKENGGLSDARNVGMAHATGEYILFLDSDDFIHPQTLELTYRLARRDRSDIVSFTYDRIYRPRLMLRHKLGMDTDNVVPHGFGRRYDFRKIKSRVTDDVFQYATERTHNPFNPRRKWLIKHCQVWKNLYRRELIADIAFIKGILFEDFPWWSQVMLQNPRVTIAPLPLYFYIPNFGGIVLSARRLRMVQSLCIGLSAAYSLYHDNASVYQMDAWSQNFRWYFIRKAFTKTQKLSDAADVAVARGYWRDLVNGGVLDGAGARWMRRLRARILDFTKE